MAIEIDGKIYRNLQEQVAANTKDIAELKKGDSKELTVYKKYTHNISVRFTDNGQTEPSFAVVLNFTIDTTYDQEITTNDFILLLYTLIGTENQAVSGYINFDDITQNVYKFNFENDSRYIKLSTLFGETPTIASEYIEIQEVIDNMNAYVIDVKEE